MPDRDFFPGLHRSWRRVGRAIAGHHPPETVSSLGEKALADQLRQDPVGAARIGQAACAIVHSGNANAIRQVVDDRDLQASPILRRLDSIARSSPLVRADEHDLVESTLDRVVRDQLDSIRPRLVADGMSATDATRYIAEGAAGIRSSLFADQILLGRARVRAPGRRRSRTSDLLHEPLA